ncbi:MAG: tetratricopeptide repeat protein [Gammaproteobacteria bacterium]
MTSPASVSSERSLRERASDHKGILFSKEELDALHRVGHALYVQGMYDDAVRYYWFLSLHAPTDARYLKGLGASLFMARRFGEAVVTYSFLTVLAPMDAEAQCMCGHALLMNGELRDAKACLELAGRLPDGKPEFTRRAKALLELIAAA